MNLSTLLRSVVAAVALLTGGVVLPVFAGEQWCDTDLPMHVQVDGQPVTSDAIISLPANP